MRRLLLLATLAAGCQRTELMVGIITDIGAPAPLDVAHLRVYPNGDLSQQPKIDTQWTLEAGFDRLPGSFGLNSGDGSSTTVAIVLTGENASGTPFITRTARLTLVGGKTLFMRMALVGACMNRSDCKSGETCREGSCITEIVDSLTLPPFDPNGNQVSNVQCGSATFVDTQSHAAISGNGAQCAGACIEGTCYQPSSGGGMNTTPGDGGGGGGGGGGGDMGTMMGGTPDLASVVQTLVLTPTSATFPMGSMQQFTARLMPTGTDVTSQAMWISSNTSIATVATAPQPNPGLVSGIIPGNVQITARLNSPPVQASAPVMVQ
jgi:hypothetical protein